MLPTRAGCYRSQPRTGSAQSRGLVSLRLQNRLAQWRGRSYIRSAAECLSENEIVSRNTGELTRTYDTFELTTGGWFANHRREVPVHFYYFLGGKLCQFRAVSDLDALQAEVLFLLGPGLEQSPQLLREGSRARAIYSEQVRDSVREGRLYILSKLLEAAHAAKV